MTEYINIEHNEGSHKRHKTRIDKGRVMVTDRDKHIITWIAQQYVAHFDQVRALLTREPGKPLVNDQISEHIVKEQIDRWRRANWITYERILAKGRGWAWVTREGLYQTNLVHLYKDTTRIRPSATQLGHLYAVNQVRLTFEKLEGEGQWRSIRQIKSELDRTEQRLDILPDGIIDRPRGKPIAIIVALATQKTALLKILTNLMEQFDDNGAPRYAEIRLYIPDSNMLKNERLPFRREGQPSIKIISDADIYKAEYF